MPRSAAAHFGDTRVPHPAPVLPGYPPGAGPGHPGGGGSDGQTARTWVVTSERSGRADQKGPCWPGRPGPVQAVLAQPTQVPGQHPGHFTDAKTKPRMGLALGAWQGTAQRLMPTLSILLAWSGRAAGASCAAREAQERGAGAEEAVAAPTQCHPVTRPRRCRVQWTGGQWGPGLSGSGGPALQMASMDLLADWGRGGINMLIPG